MMSAATGRLAGRAPAAEPCERLSQDHAAAVGRLFEVAFAGTIEDDGELLADPVADMRGALQGAFGPVVEAASLAIGSTETIRAAVVTVLMDGGVPLIAFCMTAPRWQRHGYATGLTAAAAGVLAESGHPRVFLAVHPGSPARGFYERLGFEPLPAR